MASEEDRILVDYMKAHGQGRWTNIPKRTGLNRCGKSCRLRWLNYLRPDIKRGNISPDEEELILRLHKLLGNRWSLIAGRLPGRTDNEIKNYWNTILEKGARDDKNKKLCTPKDRHYPKGLGGQTESELHETDSIGNPHSTGQSISKQGEDTSMSPMAFWAGVLEHSEVAMSTQVSTEHVRHDNHCFDILTKPENMDIENNGATLGSLPGFPHGGDTVENAALDFDFGDFCLSDLLNSQLPIDNNPCPLPSSDPRPAVSLDEPMVQNLNMITDSLEAGTTTNGA